MSANLQELAAKAGFDADASGNIYPKQDGDAMCFSRATCNLSAELKAFAELIVLECTKMCEESSAKYISARLIEPDFKMKYVLSECESVGEDLKRQMLRHFCIQEKALSLKETLTKKAKSHNSMQP